MKYVLYAILLYLAYQFIFKLVIPVYIASRKIKKSFREMHNRMQEQMGRQEDHVPKPSANKSRSGVNPDDYIEFEELK